MKHPQHVFFTSDQHFCHQSVIGMCGRPFADADDMNRCMINAWNSVVRPGDAVWHLGDFAYRGKPDRVKEIFAALNGTKNLIRGNHDKQMVTQLGWAEQADFKHLVVDGQQVNLSHYAMRSWPAMHRGAIMLYGHSHGTLPGSRQTHDVGVDAVGYVPQTVAQLRARMDALPRIAYDIGRVVETYDDQPAPQGLTP